MGIPGIGSQRGGHVVAETPLNLPVTLLWVCSIASHKCARVAASLTLGKKLLSWNPE